MGCFTNKGIPMTLSFDCSSGGVRDVKCYDTDLLSKLVKAYCGKTNIDYNSIQEVSYNYNKLDLSKHVNELGLESGCVILIKLKCVFDN